MANRKTNLQQLVITDTDYSQWLLELKSRYRQAQLKAASRVNEELLRYYWQLGADIEARGDENRYGTGFYATLSRDLREMMPQAEGFSETNLKFTVRFYRMYAVAPNCEQHVQESNRQQPVTDFQNAEYSEDTNRQQPVDESIFQIPWGHNMLIISRSKSDRTKALFYVHKTLENQWSRAILLNMMGDKDGNNGLYEAQGKALTNFAETLPKPDTELARDILKDPYNLPRSSSNCSV